MEFEPLDTPRLVSHVRDAITLNGIVAQVIASLTDAEREKLETVPEPAPIKDPLKDMVVDIVENRKSLMDCLLNESRESLHSKLPLEDETHQILEMLRPLYILESKDASLDTLRQVYSTMPAVVDRLVEKVGKDHDCTKEMEYILDRFGVTIWCLENLQLESKWTAENVLELSKRVSCNYTLLNRLGVLTTLKEDDATTILVKQPAALDFYKHNLAVSRFLPFLFKHFRENTDDESANIVDIERLVKEIASIKLRIKTLQDIYELCFLSKEDIKSDDEGSGAKAKSESQGADTGHGNVNRPSLENGEISNPSPVSKVSPPDVTAYLCRDAKKLKMTLQMLKRQLEMADAGDDDRDLLLERRKLEQHVNQALWRMELVECDATDDGWYTRHLLPNSTSDSWTSQEWLQRLDPDTLSLFGYSHARRKTKSAKIDPDEDPLIVNRLTADPRSLIIFAVFNSRFTGARQVADFYQLWDTQEGRELRIALTFSAAVKELQRLAKQLSSSADSDELKRIRMASAVETQLSLLQQAAVAEQTDDRQASVFIADLALAAHDDMAPDMAAHLLNFAFKWLDEAVDFHEEPWSTFRNYVECFNFQLEQSGSFESPLHSSLPLNVDQRKAFLDQERKRRTLLDQALAAFKGDPETVGPALQALHDGVPPKKSAVFWNPSPLLRMKHFFDILCKLLPVRLRNSSIEHLMHQDVGEMIFERLQEDPDSFQELETNANVLGIDLPWFLAARLCYPEEGLQPIVKTDLEFISRVLAYMNSKNSRLAEVIELVLQANYEVGLPTLYGTLDRFQEGAAIYRRYLEYQSKVRPKIEEDSVAEGCEIAPSPSPPPSTPEELASDDTIDDVFLELVHEVEIDPVAEMIVALAEVMPADKREQLNHLLPEPLLAIEQLFMNSQISLATDLIKVMRSRGTEDDNHAIDRLALQYATKALALGLPELPSAPAAAALTATTPSKSDVKTPRKKPPGSLAKFVIPPTAPTKEQWVPDAEVGQCPCCQTVTFSMFDRRHHCRRCGRVVCAHCSPHRHLVDGYGDVAVRTCVDCHAVLQEREDEPDISTVRSASQDGGVSWILSLDAKHNEIARREFGYEDAPNLALTLSLVHLCQSSETMANFLLEQSSSTLGTLHRYLVHGKLLDVCSDPNIIFSIVKSLIVSAKMRYSEIIASPDQQYSKAKPSRGLARCDALLDQIDLLSLLSTANCLNLLPPQPLSQKDTWRKLRDRLVEVELWSLALDVSTKAGLDSETVWAAWGLVFLRAGNFKGARQRFQRCMKPGKPSPLLQEIVQVLERLTIPKSFVPDLTKRTRRMSSSSPPSHPLFDTDAPQLIAARLARLNDIAAGRFPEMEDKHYLLPEVLYYLDTYGAPEATYVHLVEKSQRIDMAVNRFASASPAPDVFNHGLLLPCLKAGKLEDLFIEMKRHDASFKTWKKYLLAGAQLLETKGYWNSLYQLHCLSNDWIRASLVAVRRLYLGDLCSIETLVTRSHLLEDVLAHLSTYLARQASLTPAAAESESESQLPLWWPANEVANLQKTIRHQLKVTNFIDGCSRAGKVTSSLIREVKTVTQAPEAGDFGNANNYLVPTLLGSRHFRQSCAVLVACAGHDATAFELSWQICCDYRVRLDRYFRQSSFVLIRQGLIQSLIEFVEFVKSRMTEHSVGYFDMDELLVECATLIQERDKETKTPDTELVLQLIKKPMHKTRALINVGWLKAAYLLAVKGGQVADVIHIKQEAVRLQQPAVLALCDKWLRARNVK